MSMIRENCRLQFCGIDGMWVLRHAITLGNNVERYLSHLADFFLKCHLLENFIHFFLDLP